jgi:sulfate transport system substrate-binding protein
VAREYPDAGFEVVYPGLSLDVEMPVAVVERVARKHGTWDLAHAYVDFLYTPAAQEIIARNHFRPRDPGVRARFAAEFPEVPLVDVDRDLGGWAAVMTAHFAEGGIFDQVQGRKH